MKPVVFALFAGMVGCAFVQPVSAAEAAKFGEKVLYSFCGQQNCSDGYEPVASLTDVKGTLYGTTASGGSGGGGTVFALVRTSGNETVLYSFCQQQNCADGASPSASLIAVKGTLYGTTQIGGMYDSGTVFAVDTNTGAEKVLHSFGSTHDGVNPIAGLIDVKDKLYGTTFYGGTYDDGAVFVVDRKTGAENVLYSFCSKQNCADGFLPYAGLIDVSGTLYGTTTGGGIVVGDCGDGCGTVFALDPGTGVEKVLYSFCQQQNCADGQYSFASLISVNSTLYGTTFGGGSYGHGTVFSLNPTTGAETVLHSFGSGADGADPYAALIDVNGAFYGTTRTGGAHSDAGTVFALDPNTDAETVLHSFCSQQNCSDGEAPNASLIDVNGTLYGTTLVGGNYGKGTVFTLKKKR